MTIRSFDDDARGMPAGWTAAQLGGPNPRRRNSSPGLTGHAVHGTDAIGVYRPDICVDCLFLQCLETDEDIYPFSEADNGETTRAHYCADADQLMHEGMNDPKALVVAASLLIRAARTLEIK